MGIKKNLPGSGSFDAKVHEKMYSCEVQPSDQVWQAIQEKLMQEEEERKIVPFWWRSLRMAGAATALIGIGIGAFFFLQPEQDNQGLASVQERQAPTAFGTSIIPSKGGLRHVSGTGISSGIAALSKTRPLPSIQMSGVYQPAVVLGNAPSMALIDLNQANNTASDNKLPENIVEPQISLPAYTLSLLNQQEVTYQSFEPIKPAKEDDDLNINLKKKVVMNGLYVGPEGTAGSNFMWVSNSFKSDLLGSNVHFKPGIAMQGGLVVGYNFFNHLGVETGAHYDYRTTAYSANNFDMPVNGNMRLTFIDVPLNFRYQWSSYLQKINKPASFTVSAGLQYSYLARAAVDMNAKTSEFSMNNTYNGKPLLSSNYLGFQAGIGYDLYLHKNFLWNVGVQAGIMGNAADVSTWLTKNSQDYSSLTVGLHTGIRFFSNTH
jgi:outer membrane protein W